MIKNWFSLGFYDRRKLCLDPKPEEIQGVYRRFGPRISFNAVREYKRGWESADDLAHRSWAAFRSRDIKNRKHWPWSARFRGRPIELTEENNAQDQTKP